jgi:AcrR family transcriptional regulator
MPSKVSLRRQQTRETLQAIAARHFALKGIATVSVEDIIAEANISRRTFYTFFASKHELIAAVVIPVFEDGLSQLQALGKTPTDSLVTDIITVYLNLWNKHSDAFYLSSLLDAKTFMLVEGEHNRFVFCLLDLLKIAQASGQLKNDSADYSLKLLARSAVPILKIYCKDKKFQQLYLETMAGMLLKKV